MKLIPVYITHNGKLFKNPSPWFKYNKVYVRGDLLRTSTVWNYEFDNWIERGEILQMDKPT